MSRKDWRTAAAEDVGFDTEELTRQLLPVLRRDVIEPYGKPRDYGEYLAQGCRAGLAAVLPLRESEKAFLDLLLDRGVVDATILTPDPVLQDRINRQPLLAWKALNVRQYKGLGEGMSPGR